jgi:hypothetical protein
MKRSSPFEGTIGNKELFVQELFLQALERYWYLQENIERVYMGSNALGWNLLGISLCSQWMWQWREHICRPESWNMKHSN